MRAEVARIDTLSAHADANELLDWLAACPQPHAGASVVHGEAAAADAFRRVLRDRLGWEAAIPVYGETVDLSAAARSRRGVA